MDQVSIIPNLKDLSTENTSEPLFEYLNRHSVIWIDNIHYATSKIKEISEHLTAEQNAHDEVHQIENPQIITGDYLTEKAAGFRIIEFAVPGFYQDAVQVDFKTTPQPAFNKNFTLLADNIMQQIEQGYRVYILSDNQKQIERLTSIFHDINRNIMRMAIAKKLGEKRCKLLLITEIIIMKQK